jgi:hypothetical protein
LPYRAVSGSFAIIETNQKAVSDRGWNPPNRKLLSHPEIKSPDSSTTNRTDSSSTTLTPADVNGGDGLSATTLDRLLQAHVRNGGREKRRQKLDEGQTIQDALENGRRLTAGFLCANGVHSLGDPSLLVGVKLRISKD